MTNEKEFWTQYVESFDGVKVVRAEDIPKIVAEAMRRGEMKALQEEKARVEKYFAEEMRSNIGSRLVYQYLAEQKDAWLKKIEAKLTDSRSDMNTQEKLTFIREKCIAAGAEGFEIKSSGRKGMIDGRAASKSMGLADILLAIRKRSSMYAIQSSGHFMWYGISQELGESLEWNEVFDDGQRRAWNLLKTLEDQAPETIDFIYEILK